MTAWIRIVYFRFLPSIETKRMRMTSTRAISTTAPMFLSSSPLITCIGIIPMMICSRTFLHRVCCQKRQSRRLCRLCSIDSSTQSQIRGFSISHHLLMITCTISSRNSSVKVRGRIALRIIKQTGEAKSRSNRQTTSSSI